MRFSQCEICLTNFEHSELVITAEGLVGCIPCIVGQPTKIQVQLDDNLISVMNEIIDQVNQDLHDISSHIQMYEREISEIDNTNFQGFILQNENLIDLIHSTETLAKNIRAKAKTLLQVIEGQEIKR